MSCVVTKDEFISKYGETDRDIKKLKKIFYICTKEEILSANTEEKFTAVINKLLAESCSYQSFLTDINFIKSFMKENKVDTRIIDCIPPTELYRMCTDWIVSEEDMMKVLASIDSREECNPTFYTTLTLAIYEGIYSKNMEVLENLRGSDIERVNGENIVTLHDGDVSYKINISDKLADMIIKMSKVNVWERPIARNGKFKSVLNVNAYGRYEDSVFKFEKRKNSIKNDKDYVQKYYKKFDTIEGYFREVKYKKGRYRGLNIFLFGLYNRIIKRLNQSGLDISCTGKVIGDKRKIIIEELEKYRAFEVSKILTYVLNVNGLNQKGISYGRNQKKVK